MGLFKWLGEPLVDLTYNLTAHKNIEVEIEDVGYNVTEYDGSKPTLYRPQVFSEYIGQEKAKSILKAYIEASKTRNRVLPHVLIHGKAGCGKTTLAKIIANEMGVTYKEVVNSTITQNYQLIQLIEEVNGGILFIDELHSMERNMAETIYSAMEDYKYNGVAIKPFTLIGATTEYGELIEKERPFVDRFEVILELQDYTIDELALLIRQYRNMSFPKDQFDVNHYKIIAENARLTPRIAIRLTKATIYLHGDLEKVLYNHSIIAEGYTEKDLIVLKFLNNEPKGSGLSGIAQKLDTSASNYMQQIEPYLVRNNLISRTPRGRKLTQKGLNKIKELELIKNK